MTKLKHTELYKVDSFLDPGWVIKGNEYWVDTGDAEKAEIIVDALNAASAEQCPNLTPMGECIKARMAAQQAYVAGTEAPPDAVAVPMTMGEAYIRGFSLEKMRGWNACVAALAERKALEGAMANAAHDAGDVEDACPSIKRADLSRLVESISAAVYANGDGLSVTEAIGALELAKMELLKEQEK